MKLKTLKGKIIFNSKGNIKNKKKIPLNLVLANVIFRKSKKMLSKVGKKISQLIK